MGKKKKLIKAHKAELEFKKLKTKCCDKYKKGKACGRCPYIYLMDQGIIKKKKKGAG